MNVLLIGGVPSSGSSLLVRWLSKNKQLLCLPETGLFCHGELFCRSAHNFEPDNLHAQVPWVNTTQKVFQALGWELQMTGEDKTSYFPFEELQRNLGIHEKRVVVEKCPENIFAFDAYLRTDPTRKVLVTSRNLNDVCLSLTRRGFNMLEALLIWFAHSYETWRILVTYPKQVFHCRFEDFLSGPELLISKVLDFIGDVASSRVHYSAQRGKQLQQIEIQKALDISNWYLEDTAWTYQTNEEIIDFASLKLLGTQFDVLVDSTLFLTPDLGLIAPGALDRALVKGWTALGASTTSSGPISGDYRTEITRTLAKVYLPSMVAHIDS